MTIQLILTKTLVYRLRVHRSQILNRLIKKLHVKLPNQNFSTLALPHLVLNRFGQRLALNRFEGLVWLLELAGLRRLILASRELDRIMVNRFR